MNRRDMLMASGAMFAVVAIPTIEFFSEKPICPDEIALKTAKGLDEALKKSCPTLIRHSFDTTKDALEIIGRSSRESYRLRLLRHGFYLKDRSNLDARIDAAVHYFETMISNHQGRFLFSTKAEGHRPWIEWVDEKVPNYPLAGREEVLFENLYIRSSLYFSGSDECYCRIEGVFGMLE